MKTWTLKMTVTDEKSVLDYLDMLKNVFKASINLGEDMNLCSLEDPDKKERVTCTLIKKN